MPNSCRVAVESFEDVELMLSHRMLTADDQCLADYFGFSRVRTEVERTAYVTIAVSDAVRTYLYLYYTNTGS